MIEEYIEKEIELNGAYLVLAKALKLEKIKNNIYKCNKNKTFRLTKYGFQNNISYNYDYVLNRFNKKLNNLKKENIKLKNESNNYCQIIDNLNDDIFSLKVHVAKLQIDLSNKTKKQKKESKKKVKKITFEDLIIEKGLKEKLYEKDI